MWPEKEGKRMRGRGLSGNVTTGNVNHILEPRKCPRASLYKMSKQNETMDPKSIELTCLCTGIQLTFPCPHFTTPPPYWIPNSPTPACCYVQTHFDSSGVENWTGQTPTPPHPLRPGPRPHRHHPFFAKVSRITSLVFPDPSTATVFNQNCWFNGGSLQ